MRTVQLCQRNLINFFLIHTDWLVYRGNTLRYFLQSDWGDWWLSFELLHDMSILSVQMTIQRTDLALTLLYLSIFITSHSWVDKSHFTIMRICLLKTYSSLHVCFSIMWSHCESYSTFYSYKCAVGFHLFSCYESFLDSRIPWLC